MKIDFSWSIDDWIALIKDFLEIIQNFFKEIGLDFFKNGDGAGEEPAEETTT